jgi:SOS-response transcriptional repressor LexA
MILSTLVQSFTGTISTMVNYWDRLKPEMDAKGMTVSQLARAMGISFQAVAKVRDGGAFGSDNNIKAAKLFGLNSDWLASGKGQKKLIENVTALSPSPLMRQVPVISTVQAGNPAEAVNSYGPGDGSRFVWSDRGGKHTFALEIVGDSMAPEFNEGDTILIDPDVTPIAGRYVVAKCGSDDATFKKYRPRGQDETGRPVFELVPLNTNYGTLQSDRDRCEIIGVMIEHRINY